MSAARHCQPPARRPRPGRAWSSAPGQRGGRRLLRPCVSAGAPLPLRCPRAGAPAGPAACVRLYTYMCAHVCMPIPLCVCVYTSVFVCAFGCVYAYPCVCLHTYICPCVCMPIPVRVCVSMCVCACTPTCALVCVHAYPCACVHRPEPGSQPGELGSRRGYLRPDGLIGLKTQVWGAGAARAKRFPLWILVFFFSISIFKGIHLLQLLMS